MKIIITGGEGQLGRELGQIFKEEGHTVLQYSKQQLDITDRTQIREILKKIEPELIINTAAFTKVDRCETELEKAYLINGIGLYYLAEKQKKRTSNFFILVQIMYIAVTNYPLMKRKTLLTLKPFMGKVRD